MEMGKEYSRDVDVIRAWYGVPVNAGVIVCVGVNAREYASGLRTTWTKK